MALFTGTVAGTVLGALIATASPAECTLKRDVKVFYGGKWNLLGSGASLKVKTKGAQWATLETQIGGKTTLAKAATPVLEAACPALLAMDDGGGTTIPGPGSGPSKIGSIADSPMLASVAAIAVPGIPVKEAPASQMGGALEPMPLRVSSFEQTTSSPSLASIAPELLGVAAHSEPAMAPVAPVAQSAPASLSSAGDLADTAKKMVAILDLKGSDALTATANALTTLIVAEVGAQKEYKAVSRNELQALLQHQADASMLGCDTVNCLANVGKLADAQLVISGSVEMVEGAHVIALSLIDPAGPTITSREEAVWRGATDDMLPLMKPMVERLLAGEEAKEHRGRLEILAAEGATVVVDGKEVGTAPLPSAVADLPTGVHTLHVTKSGTLPFSSDVVVSRNETTIARVELEEIPLYQRPLFWVGVGSVALLAGGAAVGATTWALLQQDQSTDVVLAPKP